ncbi:MAG: MaoC family dehydratase [Firmicutes bacterium]|nr:MaoC family dehydratase [Bacillota bacterium]
MVIEQTFDQLNIGDRANVSKTISETDVYLFAGITGDFNPVHVNSEYAKDTQFSKRIAHGVLSVGLISTVLGTRLPGPGSIYLNQTVSFLAPVYVGDTITAEVEVIEKMPEKSRVKLRTTCYNQTGKNILQGEAIVAFKKAANQ